MKLRVKSYETLRQTLVSMTDRSYIAVLLNIVLFCLMLSLYDWSTRSQETVAFLMLYSSAKVIAVAMVISVRNLCWNNLSCLVIIAWSIYM